MIRRLQVRAVARSAAIRVVNTPHLDRRIRQPTSAPWLSHKQSFAAPRNGTERGSVLIRSLSSEGKSYLDLILEEETPPEDGEKEEAAACRGEGGGGEEEKERERVATALLGYTSTFRCPVLTSAMRLLGVTIGSFGLLTTPEMVFDYIAAYSIPDGDTPRCGISGADAEVAVSGLAAAVETLAPGTSLTSLTYVAKPAPVNHETARLLGTGRELPVKTLVGLRARSAMPSPDIAYGSAFSPRDPQVADSEPNVANPRWSCVRYAMSGADIWIGAARWITLTRMMRYAATRAL
eukprot:3164511-Rhodomonas_salina.4